MGGKRRVGRKEDDPRKLSELFENRSWCCRYLNTRVGGLRNILSRSSNE